MFAWPPVLVSTVRKWIVQSASSIKTLNMTNGAIGGQIISGHGIDAAQMETSS
jgi:hypothetical protein